MTDATPHSEKIKDQGAKDRVLDIFPALMMEKGYSNFTVQDILKKANIGRTTFYAHFTSKEDVLKHSVGRLKEFLIQAVKQHHIPQKPDTKLPFTLYFFMHIIDHHKTYDNIVGRDDFFLIERYILRMLKDLVSAEISISTQTKEQRIKCELIVQHLVGAIWATSIWLIERKQLSAEDVNKQFQSMAFPGLDLALKAL